MSTIQIEPTLDFYGLGELFSPDHREVIQSIQKFCTEQLKPLISDCYEEARFPTEIIPTFGQLGLLGPSVKGDGLMGSDAITYGLMMRELERVDSAFRSFASVQGSLVMHPIARYGSEEQKKKWLLPLSRGEKIGCFALTEPDGGSDPAAMKTKAKDCGDHYLINGSKMWITNGSIAHLAIIWAELQGKVRGFLVELPTEGVRITTMKQKLSLRASITSELSFHNVKIKKDQLLPEARSIGAALACLNEARFGIAFGVLGAAEECFQTALQFAKTRVLFGKPLAAKQLVQNKLAHMSTEITKAQLLAQRLAQLKDLQKLEPAQVSMAKRSNVAMALETARICRDILGANGIMGEYPVMRHLCNLETVFTYEGTHDIHGLILGQAITGVSGFGS